MIPGIVAGGAQAAAPPPPAVYWNPADKDSHIALSSGDQVATTGGAFATWVNVRSITSHASGKFYAELVNTTNVANSMMFGVAKAGESLTKQPGGAGSNSWSIQANRSSGVRTYFNGSSATPGFSAIPAGGYARIAVDIGAGKLWLGVSTSASWAGGGDPATGTAPTYSFTPGTPLYLIFGGNAAGQAVTLKSQVGEATGAVPSGFGMFS